MTTLSPGFERTGDAPAAAVVLDLLAHAEAAEVAPAGGGDGRDAEGHGVGPHGEAADRGHVVGQDGQRGVGDEEHPVGPTGRLLGVDEPVAVLAALQDEVAAPHAVAQQVVDERGDGGIGHRCSFGSRPSIKAMPRISAAGKGHEQVAAHLAAQGRVLVVVADLAELGVGEQLGGAIRGAVVQEHGLAVLAGQPQVDGAVLERRPRSSTPRSGSAVAGLVGAGDGSQGDRRVLEAGGPEGAGRGPTASPAVMWSGRLQPPGRRQRDGDEPDQEGGWLAHGAQAPR